MLIHSPPASHYYHYACVKDIQDFTALAIVSIYPAKFAKMVKRIA